MEWETRKTREARERLELGKFVRPSWSELAFRVELSAWSVTKADVETMLICDDTGISAVLEE
jgi:hypothetical protein